MIAFAAERLTEIEVGALTGACPYRELHPLWHELSLPNTPSVLA
jgi:hypothetical protein